MLRRNPGFTASAVLTLGLGIGANAAIFSLVRAVLLPGLPFPESDRLVTFEMRNQKTGERAPGLRWRDAVDLRDRARAFAGFGMQAFALLNFAGDGRPQALYGARISAGLLPLLGAQPRLGRSFVDADDRPAGAHVILLSDWLWRDRFVADPAIVGRTISLVGSGPANWLVIGVMPPDFNFPLSIPTSVNPETRRMAYWIPLALDLPPVGRGGFGSAIARLRSGVTLAQAQADADRVAANLAREFPSTNADDGIRVTPLAESVYGRSRTAMLLVLAATGLVVLIGCANIAGLLLVRAAARSRETAVRVALGASRGRLLRQWTTEALLIALLGGAAGLLLAGACRGSMLALAPPDLPGLDRVRIDGLVLAFTAGVSLLAGLIFGIAPAWQSARSDPQAAFAGGRGAVGPGRGRAGHLLVSVEAALAVLLTISAGLLTRSFARLLSIDLGYQPSHVLMAIITPFDARVYPDAAAKVHFYRRLLDELRGTPGVESAGAVIGVPLSGNFPPSALRIEGMPAAPPAAQPLAEIVPASEQYFATLGIPLLRGRVWTVQDAVSERRLAVIDETAAARFWPGRDPLGQRLAIDVQPGHPWIEVAGVVKATHEDSPDQPPSPAIYLPMEQFQTFIPQFLAVRTRAVAASFAPVLRRAVARIDPAQPVYVVNSMQSLIDTATSQRRFATSTLGIFAALALLLAAAGIYGVASYTVARRTQEIGVRMALGATRADVARLILRRGLLPAAAGIPFGLAAALPGARLLSAFLYGVTATDPLIFVGVPALLMAVAAAACCLPARRAMRVQPAAALHAE